MTEDKKNDVINVKPNTVYDQKMGETRQENFVDNEEPVAIKEPPYSIQMRIEKAEEEAMYAKRGTIPLKSYYRNLEDVTQTALKEHNLQFHEYLSLARRRQALDGLRNEMNQRLQQERAAPAKKSFPSPEETGKIVDERLKAALSNARVMDLEKKGLEQQLRDRDSDIKRLQRSLNNKTPQQLAFERRMQRKAHKIQGLNTINSAFRFPLLQKVVRKLYNVDKAVSDFLLDLGNAEYLVTKENIISTVARRLMKVRAIDEIEFYFDEKGNIINKNSKFSKNKADKKWPFDFSSNG